MLNTKSKLIISLSLFCFLIVAPLTTYAADIGDVIEGLDITAQSAKIIEEPAKAATIYDIVGRIINIVLTSLGVIFLLIMVYGGIIWMTAGGNQEKVKKAGSLISQGGIGLLIILTAFLITNFVIFKIITTISHEQSAVVCDPIEDCCLGQCPPQECRRIAGGVQGDPCAGCACIE